MVGHACLSGYCTDVFIPVNGACASKKFLRSNILQVKYSVLATGSHCQWHASICTTVLASLAHFVDPDSGMSFFHDSYASWAIQDWYLHTVRCIESLALEIARHVSDQ